MRRQATWPIPARSTTIPHFPDMAPRAAFFPANTLNTSVIEGALGVPVPVYRSLIALVIVVAVVRTLDVFDLEIDRTLSAVEEAQVLDAERARLARDLHDRTLQSVYAAGLIVTTCFEVRRQEGRTRSAESLSRAMLALDRAVEDLRSHIAELSSPPTRVSRRTARSCTPGRCAPGCWRCRAPSPSAFPPRACRARSRSGPGTRCRGRRGTARPCGPRRGGRLPDRGPREPARPPGRPSGAARPRGDRRR